MYLQMLLVEGLDSRPFFGEINNPCKLAPVFPVLQKKNPFVFYDYKSVYPASIFSSIHRSNVYYEAPALLKEVIT